MNIFTLCFLLAGSKGALNPDRTLLIATTPNTQELASSVAGSVGTVDRQDTSGMYVVRLNRSVDLAAAEKTLSKYPAVKYAMPYRARFGSHQSLEKVRAHLEYLEAGDALHGRPKEESGEEKGSEATEWYEALYDFMLRRVNSNGVIDQQAISNAILQRDQLPAAGRERFMTAGNPGDWEFIGPKNLTRPQQQYFGTAPFSGRVNCVAYDPTNSSIIYAGSATGGVWKSLDAGATWKPLSDTWKTMCVSSIAVDPTNGKNIYVGTGDYYGVAGKGIGLMMSKDGGATWTNTGSADFGKFSVSKVLVDKFIPTMVTVTAGHGAGDQYSHGGIWRSQDSGKTWKRGTVADTCYSDVCLYFGWPQNEYQIEEYFAVGDGPNGGYLYLSTWAYKWDWSKLIVPNTDNESDMSIAAETSGNSSIFFYILQPNAVDKEVWQYDSYTRGFESVSDTPGNTGFPKGTSSYPMYNWSQGSYDHFAGTSPITRNNLFAGDALWIGLVTLAMGEETYLGETWKDVGQTYETTALLHSDQHGFAVDPNNSNKVLIGNDGGVVHLTMDWDKETIAASSLNGGLGIGQIYRVAPHPSDPSQVLTGAQDNGAPLTRGNLDNWSNFQGSGDGGWCAYDLTHGFIYSAGAKNGYIGRQPLTGGVTTAIRSSYPTPCSFIPPMVVSNDHNDVAFASNYLYLQDYGKTTWRVLAQNLTAGNAASNVVTCLATCPDDPTILYSGAMDGTVWRLANYQDPLHPSLRRLDNPASYALPKQPVLALASSQDNSSDLLAGLGSSGIHHLYRCHDTQGSLQWIDVSGSGTTGLPDSPVNAIARDPFHPDTDWYVGTDVGVFTTINGGATWENMTQPLGLPNVQVNDLKFGAGFLYAGTFGRGIWRIPLAVPTSLASISLAPGTVIGGKSATGTVTLAQPSGGDGCEVALTSSAPAIALLPSYAFVGATETTSDFIIDTKPVGSKTLVTITGDLGGGLKTATLTVEPPVLSAITAPGTLEGGRGFKGTVSLETIAPASGITVALSSSSGAVKLPATVVVANPFAATFSATTSSVALDTGVTLKATFNGISRTCLINLSPPKLEKLVISPNPVIGGNVAKGTVTLSELAPAGFTLSLSSSSVAAAVPATLTVAVGKLTAPFNVLTHGVVVSTDLTVSAADKDYTAASALTVLPAGLLSLTTATSTIAGGNVGTGHVNLNGFAGVNGVKVTLSSNRPTLAAPPASVTVLYNTSTVAFTYTPKAVSVATSVTFSGSYGTITKSVVFTVEPAALISLALSSQSVTGGTSVKGTVVLSGWAPSAGAVVALKSDSSVAAVPTSVTVLAGKSAASFTITTKVVTAVKTVHITAVYGAITKTNYITVH